MTTTGASETTTRRYLTRSDVARLLEVSPATIARWTRAGKLPFVLTLGGQRRYPRERITELMREGAQPHAEPLARERSRP
ncbi:MAG TPA: helix-turn-helix domain-containing protein [Methylomirabilota bacterium]|jgi:excisionase family DNA binding protein|nr:helix-turn-helix domain-containing protein [Methylomirabilota bacterium]